MIAGLVPLAAGLVVTVSMVVNLPGVSPIDEWAYIDSLDQADNFDLARPGEVIGEYARDVISCRGVYGVGQVGNPCGFDQPNDKFPLGAVSPAPIHPPTYFLITAMLSKPLRWLGVTNDLVFAGRLAGALWLTAGGLLLTQILILWNRPWYLAPALTSALAISPTVSTVIGFLSPDATFLVSGSLPLLGVSLWLKRRWSVWTLGVFGAAPVLLKTTHILATLATALTLAVGAVIWRNNREVMTKALRGALALVVGAGLAIIGWLAMLNLLEISQIPAHPEPEPEITASAFASLIGYPALTFPRTSGAPIPLPGASVLAGELMLFVAIGGTIGALLFSRDRRLLTVTLASSFMWVFGALLLTSLTFVTTGGFLVPTPRYSLGLAALFYIPLLGGLRSSVVLGFLTTVGIIGVIAFLMW